MESTPINYITAVDNDENEFMEASTLQQVAFLKEYITDFPSKGIELLSHFEGKYRCSGVSSLAKILESVCVSSGFSGDIKLIAAYALLSFTEELPDASDDDDDMSRVANCQIIDRNKMRITRGIFSLQMVVDEIVAENMSTILKFQAIIKLHALAESEKNRTEIQLKCDTNMKKLLSNKGIEANYRLRLIARIPSHDLQKECFIFFLGDPGNPTSMRILAAQGILSWVKNTNESDVYDVVMAQVEIFARDEELDTFIRADAADVLLGHGNEELKQQARIIINEIGTKRGYGIYENTQNVHADSVDESIRASLDTLNTWRTDHQSLMKSFDDTLDDFNARKNAKERTPEEIKDTETALFRIIMGSTVYNGFTTQALFCTIYAWIRAQEDGAKVELWNRLDQEIADMVNTCTTGIVSRLINVLSGWGGFQINISFKDQIKSNFAGRLNAVARKLVLSAVCGSHQFYKKMENGVALVYIADCLRPTGGCLRPAQNNDTLLAAMADRGIDTNGNDIVNKNNKQWRVRQEPTAVEKIQSFEKEHPALHQLARQHFSDRLFLEFSIEEPNRKCFHLFFSYCFSKVAEELRKEFKDFMDPNDFEMCMRDAISFYEGST